MNPIDDVSPTNRFVPFICLVAREWQCSAAGVGHDCSTKNNKLLIIPYKAFFFAEHDFCLNRNSQAFVRQNEY